LTAAAAVGTGVVAERRRAPARAWSL